MTEKKSGTLLAIATKKMKRAPMTLKESIHVTVERGVEEDHRGKPGDRQVTVISKDSWDAACHELGKQIPWIARRANILISGIVFEESKGKFIKIGDLLLEITGETKPCDRMDEFYQGLQDALKPEWRGGVTCKVIKSGYVKLGDNVTLADSVD
jgi:MOSC domain-containing protein YiiM